MKKKTKNTIKKVAVAGMAAAAGAGAYYLLGPKGKAHQKEVKDWVTKMKGGVEEKIDSLEKTYHKEYKMHAPAITAFAKKLKTEIKKVPHKIVVSGSKKNK